MTEREIALGLIDRAAYLDDQDLVRARDGFSLLDLKRFVDRCGYEDTGFGRLNLDNLLAMIPIIVPVWLAGVPHFVVARGAYKGRVVLADPLFGNRTMPLEAFERVWLPYEGLGRVGFKAKAPGGPIAPSILTPEQADFVTLG